MNFLGSNLKYLRKEKGLTQEKLASKIGVKRSLIGAYEEGRAEPKLQTIFNICHYFDLSIDSLINTDLGNQKVSAKSDFKGSRLRLLPIVVNGQSQKELSILVPGKAAAGYLKGFEDVDFIESLPKFDLSYPELSKNRTYRLFQIHGESMLPVPSESYIICEYVQNWYDIKNEKPYVLITKEDGIVYKRVINNINEGALILRSDNPDFKDYSIQADQLIEVWEAKGYTSFDLPQANAKKDREMNISQITDMITQLQDDVKLLKQKLLNE